MTCLRVFLRGFYHDLKDVAGLIIMLLCMVVPALAFFFLTTPLIGENTRPWVVLGWALLMMFVVLVSLQFSVNLYNAWRDTDIERIVARSYEGEREVVAAEMRAIDERLRRCDYTEIRVRNKDVTRLFELRRRFHRS